MSPIPVSDGRVQGCYRCGAKPTTNMVGLQARSLAKNVGKNGKSANPYKGRAVIRQKSFCEPCANEAWDVLWDELTKKKERV